jgi:hypothetical protein
VLAEIERIEVGNTVNTEHYGLAVDDEPLLPVIERGLDDPRGAVAPGVPVAGEQPDAIAVPVYQESKAVIFHFVDPLRQSRALPRVGMAGWNCIGRR